MSALDLYHNTVRTALIKEGGMITHDPLHLRWGRKDMYEDLGVVLYMAVRDVVYHSLFEEPIGQILIEDEQLKIVVFNLEREVILTWKS